MIWLLDTIGGTFSNTITLGSIIVGILVSLSALAVFFYGVRWKSAYLVAEANAEAWHQTADRLQTELDRLRTEVATLQASLAELKALPDVQAVYQAVVAHDERQAAAMKRHDAHAEIRTNRLIEAIHQVGQPITTTTTTTEVKQ